MHMTEKGGAAVVITSFNFRLLKIRFIGGFEMVIGQHGMFQALL